MDVEQPDAVKRAERRAVRQIALYFAVLPLLVGLGGGIAGIPVSFFLKDQLKLSPQQMAVYGAITGFPACVGFLFGFLRDRWRPFGWGDRGYFLLTPPLIAGGYLWLTAGPLTYGRLVAASLVTTIFGLMLGAAMQGLMAAVAQRHALTGRLAALSLFIGSVPGILASLIGGWLTSHVAIRTTLWLAAALFLVTAGVAFWKPRAVFEEQIAPERPAAVERTRHALARLARHRPLYPVAAILLLWSFVPGWGTPLFFYLTNTVKLSSEAFGTYSAIGGAFFLISAGVYGILCQRVRLRTLLWWGILLGLASCPLFLLIRNAPQAFAVAALMGALNGIGSISLRDLLMRSCPKALEGVASMFGGAMMAIAGLGSDVFGSWLYERGGFVLALGVTALTTALILPLLLVLPRRLIVTRDGEPLADAVETPPAPAVPAPEPA